MTPTQRYISDELFHFVARHKQENERYEIFKKILTECKLGTGNPDLQTVRFNSEKPLSSNEAYIPGMVCFCDIPLGDIALHMKKYTFFGISFLKNYLITQGANPVWYISKNSTLGPNPISLLRKNCNYHDEKHKYVQKLDDYMENNKSFDDRLKNEILCYFLHIFSFMVFFEAEKEDLDKENYYMEREWRLQGVLNFKNINNIHRVILPKSFSKQFRKDFPDYFGQISYA